MVRSLCVLVVFLASAAAAAQRPPTPGVLPPASAPTPAAAPGAGSPAAPSEADRVARLSAGIRDGEKLLGELRARLSAPDSEYAQAEAEFNKVGAELESKRNEYDAALDGDDGAKIERLQAEVSALEERRKLLKDRFDLAIQERKALNEQIATLETRIAQDKEALDLLLAAPASQPASPGATSGASESPPPVAGPAPTEASTAVPGPAVPSAPPVAAPAPAAPAAAPPRKEVVEAQAKADEKRSAAQEAQQQVQSIDDRLTALQRNIELERQLLDTGRRRAENARETERTLDEQAWQRLTEGAPAAEVRDLRAQAASARARRADAERESGEIAGRLDRLQRDLLDLQGERIGTLQEAERRRGEAEAAEQKLSALQNPFSPRNMLRWLQERGPRIIVIVLAMALLLWLARVARRRIVHYLSQRYDRGDEDERENRSRTLVGVFHSAASVAIYGAGLMLVLDQVGLNLVPLLGGAAVAGLAVAFGAQNLIRDYFYGFMILLENQYAINDVVKIGDVSGQVERVTLRITVLRDLEGVVHFIPNGGITRVSNMTHGWSRAMFDIGVAYKEDVDQVMQVLLELGRDLRRDPAFRGMILDNPEMLGVERFDESSVVVRFLMKTRPLKQWAVKREMLRRIKKRFDELSIEIPFPHRTVFLRPAEAAGDPAGADEAAAK